MSETTTSNLVTIPEIAEEYNVTRQAIISIKNRHKDEFPDPVIKLGNGGAYDRDAIVAFFHSINWLDENGNRNPGVGRRINPGQVIRILSAFDETGKIKSAAEAAGVSEPTARQHLIRAGKIPCNCPCHEEG